jgi:hypothetical protein
VTWPISWASTVVGQGQEAAGHVDVAAGQRKGVDDGRIEDREVPVQVRQLGSLGQQASEAVDIGPELRVVVLAAELPDDFRMLLAAQLDLVLSRQAAGEDVPPGRRRLGAARERQGGRQTARGQQQAQLSRHTLYHGAYHRAHRLVHQSSITSICSGWLASIMGPL